MDMKERIGSSQWGDLLIVPIIGAGHVRPLMHVAARLMERGITITVVIPEDERALVEKNLESKYMEAGGLVRFELVKSVSKLDEKDKGLVGWSTNLERVCEPALQKLLAEQESGVVPFPKCIIADQFVGWTQVWANKLGIPRYVSFPSPAAYAVTMLCHGTVEEQLEHISDKEDANPIMNIPQLPLELHTNDLPESFLHNHSFRKKVVDRSGDSFQEAAGILFNTFYELESETVDSLQAEVERVSSPGKVTKMLPIGPMLPSAFFREEAFNGETDMNSTCLKWLSTRPVSSVLYIAFGSWAFLSSNQIQELAHGLEASQVSFLWILRVEGSGDVSQYLPPGFYDNTRDRGFVYSEFAPQLQILSHPSTGGFLTHCGWNSSLESICRGVPMVGWPMQAEQGICCRVLVDLAKVATQIHKGSDGLVGREDIQRALRLLMKEPRGQDLKRRAVELQHLARAAVAPGGSSYRNFERFVNDVLGQQ